MLCLISPEKVVPIDHPIRKMKRLCDVALGSLAATFDAMYGKTGRPSIPPERLLKGTLLMALYTVRSERQFCEQLSYNLLFRWFLDMSMVETAFEHSAFSHNRARLLEHDVAGEFFRAVVAQAKAAHLMSADHFTVDGTMIEACASLKGFKKREAEDDDDGPDDPGNPTVDFRGEARRNDTHVSTTDPEARLFRKGTGKEAKLAFTAHALMENRHGLLVDFRIAAATGTAERDVALDVIATHKPPLRAVTLGADKGYDTKNFVVDCRAINVVPHIAQNASERRRSAIDARTTRHPGYSVSQRIRKRVEAVFGSAGRKRSAISEGHDYEASRKLSSPPTSSARRTTYCVLRKSAFNLNSLVAPSLDPGKRETAGAASLFRPRSELEIHPPPKARSRELCRLFCNSLLEQPSFPRPRGVMRRCAFGSA